MNDSGAFWTPENGALPQTDVEIVTADGPYSIALESPPLGLFGDFVHAVLDPAHQPLVTTAETINVTEVTLMARQATDTGETLWL